MHVCHQQIYSHASICTTWVHDKDDGLLGDPNYYYISSQVAMELFSEYFRDVLGIELSH
jgi:hypothetical protein